jgi:hypothetical protein
MRLVQEMAAYFFGGAQRLTSRFKRRQITIASELDDCAFVLFNRLTDRQNGILQKVYRLILRDRCDMGARAD